MKTYLQNILASSNSLKFDESASSVEKLRGRIIYFVNQLILIGTFVLLIIRLIEGNIDLVISNVLILLGVILSLVLCKKRFYKTAIIFTAIYLFIPNIILGIRGTQDIYIIYIYLILLPIGFAILFSKFYIRNIYFLLCMITFTVLFYDSLLNTAPFYVLSTVFYVCSLAVVKFSENQQIKIETAIKNQEKISKEKSEAINKLEIQNKNAVIYSHIMSHDLKAPLRSIKGFTKLLKHRLSDGEQLEYVNFINDASDTMEMLVSDLLIYTRTTTAEYDFAKVDLNKLVNEVMLIYRQQIELGKLKLTYKDLPTIYANKEAVKIVFENLLSNAIKYQPKNKAAHTPTIEIKSEDYENSYKIIISDNGIGIEEENHSELFEPFRRFHAAADYKGTGLGTSICKNIMEKHNGIIKLEKTSVEGTSFALIFP